MFDLIENETANDTSIIWLETYFVHWKQKKVKGKEKSTCSIGKSYPKLKYLKDN